MAHTFISTHRGSHDAQTLLAGATIAITLDGDTVVLNGEINVTATDIAASNGVIHVIDGVLLPIQ